MCIQYGSQVTRNVRAFDYSNGNSVISILFTEICLTTFLFTVYMIIPLPARYISFLKKLNDLKKKRQILRIKHSNRLILLFFTLLFLNKPIYR